MSLPPDAFTDQAESHGPSAEFAALNLLKQLHPPGAGILLVLKKHVLESELGHRLCNQFAAHYCASEFCGYRLRDCLPSAFEGADRDNARLIPLVPNAIWDFPDAWVIWLHAAAHPMNLVHLRRFDATFARDFVEHPVQATSACRAIHGSGIRMDDDEYLPTLDVLLSDCWSSCQRYRCLEAITRQYDDLVLKSLAEFATADQSADGTQFQLAVSWATNPPFGVRLEVRSLSADTEHMKGEVVLRLRSQEAVDIVKSSLRDRYVQADILSRSFPSLQQPSINEHMLLDTRIVVPAVNSPAAMWAACEGKRTALNDQADLHEEKANQLRTLADSETGPAFFAVSNAVPIGPTVVGAREWEHLVEFLPSPLDGLARLCLTEESRKLNVSRLAQAAIHFDSLVLFAQLRQYQPRSQWADILRKRLAKRQSLGAWADTGIRVAKDLRDATKSKEPLRSGQWLRDMQRVASARNRTSDHEGLLNAHEYDYRVGTLDSLLRRIVSSWEWLQNYDLRYVKQCEVADSRYRVEGALLAKKAHVYPAGEWFSDHALEKSQVFLVHKHELDVVQMHPLLWLDEPRQRLCLLDHMSKRVPVFHAYDGTELLKCKELSHEF